MTGGGASETRDRQGKGATGRLGEGMGQRTDRGKAGSGDKQGEGVMEGGGLGVEKCKGVMEKGSSVVEQWEGVRGGVGWTGVGGGAAGHEYGSRHKTLHILFIVSELTNRSRWPHTYSNNYNLFNINIPYINPPCMR